jgi:hypothetical protein
MRSLSRDEKKTGIRRGNRMERRAKKRKNKIKTKGKEEENRQKEEGNASTFSNPNRLFPFL